MPTHNLISVPPDPFLEELIAATQQHRSWRLRLQWLRDRLGDLSFELSAPRLAAVAVYLRLLATGELPCTEDGGHYRPNHHAEAAFRIEQALEQRGSGDQAWIARRILPYLPSWEDSFRRAEPLTRIRDIAHRNDIPSELKREIKTRLQNKLHRCAGPEDLLTAEELLARITAPAADYSPAFVQEFRLFHQELREFFNAVDLSKRLADLARDVPSLAPCVGKFLAKSSTTTGLEGLIDQLQVLTEIRRQVNSLLPQQSPRIRSQLRLADIGLEDRAFTLFAECANQLEQLNSPEVWPPFLATLTLSVENVRLDLLEADSFALLLSELTAWSNPFLPGNRLHQLRVRATLKRLNRLAEEWSDRLYQLFSPAVERLGSALGVAESAIRVFVEGDVRGHLIFQLSRLVERGLRLGQQALSLPPLEAIVNGEAVGPLIQVSDLKQLHWEDVAAVVLLERAEGDEDIPNRVQGILLAHPIPHLSHLGVRARQARVPFACCVDPTVWPSLQSQLGQQVLFRVQGDLVELQPSSARSSQRASPTVRPAPVLEAGTDRWTLPLEEATAELCGAKAASAGRLRQLAEQSGGLFQAPSGLALPYTAFERCLESAGLVSHYRNMLQRLEKGERANLERHAAEMRHWIERLPVAEPLSEQLRTSFRRSGKLAVRSSSNTEDLPGLSGAGMHDSVIGVSSEEVLRAVLRVWASLWTARAVLSRSQAGISHSEARMGVLIQQLVAPEYSFILHTTNPLSSSQSEAVAEIAVGLGEILASGGEVGTPYRLRCPRDKGDPQLLTCADFAVALRPMDNGQVSRELLDYSRVALSATRGAAEDLAVRLGRLADYLETQLGAAQDVEGVLVGPVIHLVQARPQQGL